MEFIFRSLLVFTAVLTCVFWCAPYANIITPSLDQLLLLQQNGLGASLPNSVYAYWGSFVIWQTLILGLFFYSSIARVGFVVFYAINSVATLFYGMQVYLPYENFLLNLLGLADGAILAIMYLTSVNSKFIKIP